MNEWEEWERERENKSNKQMFMPVVSILIIAKSYRGNLMVLPPSRSRRLRRTGRPRRGIARRRRERAYLNNSRSGTRERAAHMLLLRLHLRDVPAPALLFITYRFIKIDPSLAHYMHMFSTRILNSTPIPIARAHSRDRRWSGATMIDPIYSRS